MPAHPQNVLRDGRANSSHMHRRRPQYCSKSLAKNSPCQVSGRHTAVASVK